MKVTISKKALQKLTADNIKELTISIKSSGGWSVSGSPFIVFGGCDDLDGTFSTTEVEGITVHVKTCIKSPSDELVINFGGLFKKVFYITGSLDF